eukprot:CAMPEP_0116823888 /NCGR_PEP_ID=MMETSP0418-20121206/1091_1 /TAXON_ID=1158023 /ORGANISM="Astrosyne radiata, Strain 13vi08-1A" /LENGTH=485 /DNA_ID=CAMNT_0004452197 /DNA_START=154 /DNA_END=1611 /DNA_ORIENTATION=+
MHFTSWTSCQFGWKYHYTSSRTPVPPMKRGFLNDFSAKDEYGPLRDERSLPPRFGTISSISNRLGSHGNEGWKCNVPPHAGGWPKGWGNNSNTSSKSILTKPKWAKKSREQPSSPFQPMTTPNVTMMDTSPSFSSTTVQAPVQVPHIQYASPDASSPSVTTPPGVVTTAINPSSVSTMVMDPPNVSSLTESASSKSPLPNNKPIHKPSAAFGTSPTPTSPITILTPPRLQKQQQQQQNNHTTPGPDPAAPNPAAPNPATPNPAAPNPAAPNPAAPTAKTTVPAPPPATFGSPPLRPNTTNHNPSSNNHYASQPWLPNKTMHVPKAALAAWYNQKPRNHQLSKDCYISWNDGGLPHQLKFTSIFVCPLTGEIFCSGRHGSGSATNNYTTTTDEQTGATIVWYSKKTLAEHGAAARAYDCFSYRQHFGTGIRSVHIGSETPYLPLEQARALQQPLPPPLPTVPPEAMEKLQVLLTAYERQEDDGMQM